ncbi:MAG: hydantoinase/oxoprolinase family protein [Planctomycetota bacterium]
MAVGPDFGVDAGGTFTDFVGADGRGLKLPSNALEPATVLTEGIAALADARFSGASQLEIVHGTTIATNAILTGQLARVGLLITAGFRDLLQLGRQARPELYDLNPQPPFAPPPRRLIEEVPERLDAQGKVVLPLDEEALLHSATKLKSRGAEALAICFLHSWRNAKHEKRAGVILSGLGLPVSISAAIAPEFREFERFSTAYTNASLMPLLGRYVAELKSRLPPLQKQLGLTAVPRVSILASDAGRSSLDEAAQLPVKLVLSGPAGGVIGAWRGAATKTRRKLMTLDLGGTSADVALLDGGEPIVHRCLIAGRPLMVPVVDVHTVGAGGGSIARKDRGGALAVGPASAGADPGPAAYGRGGPATVTDAHLVLGRMLPGHFLGGDFELDVDASWRSIEQLSVSLNLEPLVCAEGVLQVAEVTMERALRRISLERGHDPRQFSLVAFGGAGALHAAALARGLGMTEVVVPRDAGMLSARGMMQARVRRESSRSMLGKTLSSVEKNRDRLIAPLRRDLDRALAHEDVAKTDREYEVFADLRYRGQSHEITVPFRGVGTKKKFAAAHRQLFGFDQSDISSSESDFIECVALRLRVSGPQPKSPRYRRPPTPKGDKALQTTMCVFDGKRQRTSVFDRLALRSGKNYAGPAIVVEYSATTVVPPDFDFHLEASQALVLTRRPKKRRRS